MTLGIAIVQCVVELTVLRSAHMRVSMQTSSDGYLARISLPLTNPHRAVIAVFVVNVAHL
jgi:hypothetical protein